MPKRTRPYREWQLEKLTDPEIAAAFLNASLRDGAGGLSVGAGQGGAGKSHVEGANESGLQRETLYRSLSEKGTQRWIP